MTSPAESALAVVTGASSGIGRALALRLAAERHPLVLVARDRSALERVAEEIRTRHGAPAGVVVVDLTREDAARAVHERVAATGLPAGILVNNAGFGALGSFATADPVALLDMVRLNVLAPTELCRCFLPNMLAHASGKILNVASTAAFQAGPSMAVYYATKAYLLHLSEALWEETRGSGVSVTALCPGPVQTAFQDRAGVGRPSAWRRPLFVGVDAVADAGYRGMMAGRRIVIPGALNRWVVRAVHLVPRVLAARIAGATQARR